MLKTIDVKAPTFDLDKRLWDLIQHEHYFDMDAKDFFRDAVKSLVSCKLSEMSYDDMKRLEKKFNVTDDELCI